MNDDREQRPSAAGKQGVAVAASPRIAAISWGSLRLTDEAEPYKDAKLWPGGAREWDWSETGTSHDPGIQPGDLEDLLDHGAEVVVLGIGMNGRMKVPDETLDLLRNHGITTHVLKTQEAVTRYNELRERRAVGGLFHTTC